MNSRLLTGIGIESRQAFRGLSRSPGFSGGVVLVLGIAIAGMVTVATAAYALFLRPLPFTQPEQLAQISIYSHSMGFEVGTSPPMLGYFRDEPMIADLAAWNGVVPANSSDGDIWQNALVTHNLFAVLGVDALVGRSFAPADGEPGSLPVALISESAWRSRYAASESAIGSSIDLNGERLTVIGVIPDSFSVPSPATEMWRPIRYTPEDVAPDQMTSFSGGRLIARLEPGYTAAQLQSALRARYSDDHAWVQERMGMELHVNGLREAWTAEQRQPLAMIGLASLLVLAAALFNVAGLWLARLLARSHEQAIQAALGAGAWRRLGRTVIEFLLLGAAAACVALALTPLTLGWLKELTLNHDQPLPVHSGPATVAITFVVLGLGSLPVLMAAAWQQRRQRRELLTDLSGGGRGHANSGARTRRVLIIAQVALAMSLLCAMGLLLRSWHGLLTEDLGFDPQNLLVAKIEAPADSDDSTREADPRVAAALDAVRGISGVTGVAFTSVAPFGPFGSMNIIPVPGQDDRDTSVHTPRVGENYFRTIGIPLLRGRDFEAGDSAKDSIIVDEYFASKYFPDGGAVGERIRVSVGREARRDAVIIGVAGTAKLRAPDEQPEQGTVYGFMPAPLPKAIVVVATQVAPATLIDEVRNALEQSLGPDRTGSRIASMEGLVRDTVRDREPQLILLGLFGAETLALAAIGLFSLLAYSVRARTAEFGVRQAVGASAGDIRRHVLADGVRLLIPGLAIGIAGAWLAGVLVANRLYKVSPVDPVTWLAIGLVLTLVVLAAGIWPAERAARIEPTEALRYE